MKQLIKKSDFKLMPWKNGKGVTAEIDISPLNSDFTKNDFDWRVSSALITSGSDFSIFPGFDRWLTVIDGAGLKLNNQILEFSEFFYFRGEDRIACELLAGSVEDFGVIFNRDLFNCSVQLKEIAKEETINFGPGIHFIKPLRSKIAIDNKTIEAGDIFKIVGQEICIVGSVNVFCRFLEFSLVLK